MKRKYCRSRFLIFSAIVGFALVSLAWAQDTENKNLTVEQTVTWINGILSESGEMIIFTKSNNTFWHYNKYKVKVGTSGSLWINYTLTTAVMGSDNDPVTRPKSEEIDNWLSLSTSDVGIVHFKETSWGSKLAEAQPEDEVVLQSGVLAVKQGESWKFLVPIRKFALEEKLLKAFRHLLQQTKKEHVDPF